MEERTPEPLKNLQQETQTELKKNVPTVTDNGREEKHEPNNEWKEDVEFWKETQTQRQEKESVKPKRKSDLNVEAQEFIPNGKYTKSVLLSWSQRG